MHAAEEGEHPLCDEGAEFLKHEMAGIEDVELEVGQVAFIGMGARLREDHMILAPDQQSERRRARQTAC